MKSTEAKAKEIRKVAEGLIALAVKEKDNFETVKVTAKVARKDKDGKRVKEVVDGKSYIELGDEENQALQQAVAGRMGDADLGRKVNDAIQKDVSVD